MKEALWKSPEDEEIFATYLAKMGIAWWIEVITKEPKSIYYFGPFASNYIAETLSKGYIEDLEQEKAQIINVDIQRGQPKQLTIFENEFDETLKERLQPIVSSFPEAWLG